MDLGAFREIVMADFEFEAHPGERSIPLCLVAREFKSSRQFRIFQGEFGPAPPYATGPDVLFVAYYASDELGCYRILCRPMPERILDLFTEFRDRTNGLGQAAGLLDALVYFGFDPMNAGAKKDLQEAIGAGTWPGRYTPEQILDYCETDMVALERLLPAMLPQIDLPRALLRGRYMAAAAVMEHNGTPIDLDALARLRGLGGHPRPTHSRDRRLWNLRRSHLQIGAVDRIDEADGNPLAAARERRSGFV